MSLARAEAQAMLRRAIDDREAELTDAWKASEDPEERERLHAKLRATVELEDLLEARYGPEPSTGE